MSTGRNKVCPRCGSIEPIASRECRRCGRQFRTQFAGSSGTVVSRLGTNEVSRRSSRGSKIAPVASLLPTEFHRPSEENPDFAAPTGMPPTYRELPNIEVLRTDLAESLSKFGSTSAEPFSQLFLADAPGSPLTFDPPALPNLLPFPSSFGPETGWSDTLAPDRSEDRIDWTRPETFLGAMPGAGTFPGAMPGADAFPGTDSKPVTPMEFGSAVSETELAPQRDFALNVNSVVASAIEVDEDHYLSAQDLLPYDKALAPTNKWLRYGLGAVLVGCGLWIVFSTATYLHLKTASVITQALVTLSPVNKSATVAEPIVRPGQIASDGNGDFLKPAVVSEHSAIKGLNPSVFSQLKSGNDTVGVIDAAPTNVAVLPIGGGSNSQAADSSGSTGSSAGADDSDSSSSPADQSDSAVPGELPANSQVFIQTSYAYDPFHLQKHHRRRKI